jgi:ribosomal protein S18 acetylase RimI-like enzyme
MRRTYDLIVRCDINDYGEPDAELEDLQSAWSQIDLQRDAWLALAPADGMSADDTSADAFSAADLIAYGAVSIYRQELQIDLYLDPSYQDLDLATTLLARCEARGTKIAEEQGRALVARTYVAHNNQRLAEIVTGAGYHLANIHYQMEVRLDGPPTPPCWPEGITGVCTARAAVPGQDDRAIYRLVERAFARPGRRPVSFDEWADLMVRVDAYDPDLWFLALAGEQLAGVCLGLTYPGLGWVRQLAVAEDWRRKGLGTALLNHAFGVFKSRGYQRAGLAVEVKNEEARAFYQQAGLRPTRQHDEYAKTIGKERGGR